MISVITPVSAVFAIGTNTSFGVKTLVGEDTTPPSTPVLENVVPVSPSQINVVWGASTDNYLLGGYRLFRDGQQIATTTQTSFSDTGLASSTLYTYTVDAFDSSLNLSSTSLPVATTTLAPSAIVPTSTIPTTTSHKTTSTQLLELQSFSLVPTSHSAEIHFQTNINVRYTISWGRTASYELGTVSTSLFKQGHETTLENLEPGTRYWYSIEIEDTAGNAQILKAGDFATIPSYQSIAPTNVRNIHAVVTGDDVALDWVNPVLAPGSKVRVVRSYFFYPLVATDGALVYEGDGAMVIDTGALHEHSPQYYTIFVIDAEGNVSSGAVVAASKTEVGTLMPNSSSTPPKTSSSLSSSTVSVPDSILDESGDTAVLHANAVFVRQGLTVQAFSDGIKLDADIPYTVYIPVGAVVTHLKSILVSIKDPTDQRIVTTYLLKLNKDGDAYVADIDPPHVVGVAGMTVEVFDFYLASVRRLTAPITFITTKNPEVVFPDNIVALVRAYGYIVAEGVGFFAFLWWLIVFWRRRREDKS
jgi:chitodextrinase